MRVRSPATKLIGCTCLNKHLIAAPQSCLLCGKLLDSGTPETCNSCKIMINDNACLKASRFSQSPYQIEQSKLDLGAASRRVRRQVWFINFIAGVRTPDHLGAFQCQGGGQTTSKEIIGLHGDINFLTMLLDRGGYLCSYRFFSLG